MDEKEIYAKLNEIYQRILKKPVVNLGPDTTAADIPGWDSLTHTILIDEIETTLNIKFKLMEIMNFNNVGDMVACIMKRTKA